MYHLNPDNNFIREVLLLSPFYVWGNWNTVKLSNLSNLSYGVKENPRFKPNLILEHVLLTTVVWTFQQTKLKDMNQLITVLFTKIQKLKYQGTT